MPRFYGFDGSTGMDLRPVGQLEAEDAARRERERRRHPMPVTTRIRLVSQPPEGLLPLSLFDRVGLADRKSLYPRSMETVPPDLAGLYVDYMTRVAMGTPVRVAFHVLFDEYGPVVWDGFDFEGGYTDRITSGSGDFLTADTLWDFKVSSYRPNPMYTLQLLVYWRMGLHSVHDEYRMVRRLGFFNPRRDEVWLLDVDRIDGRLVDWTDHELIGYPKD